jgi:hypothetical protein
MRTPHLKELIEPLPACNGVIYFLTAGCELLPLPALAIPLLLYTLTFQAQLGVISNLCLFAQNS